jgi:hypothetical protein
MLAH